MRIDRIKLPVFRDNELKNEWFDVNDISRVTGIHWTQTCKMLVAGEWLYVAMPVSRLLERCQ